MKHGKYIGPRADLRFCGALVRPDPRSRRHVLAQFDNVRRVHEVTGRWVRCWASDLAPECYGWHRFKRSDFRIRRNQSSGEQRSLDRRWERLEAERAASIETVTVFERHGAGCDCMACRPWTT